MSIFVICSCSVGGQLGRPDQLPAESGRRANGGRSARRCAHPGPGLQAGAEQADRLRWVLSSQHVQHNMTPHMPARASIHTRQVLKRVKRLLHIHAAVIKLSCMHQVARYVTLVVQSFSTQPRGWWTSACSGGRPSRRSGGGRWTRRRCGAQICGCTRIPCCCLARPARRRVTGKVLLVASEACRAAWNGVHIPSGCTPTPSISGEHTTGAHVKFCASAGRPRRSQSAAWRSQLSHMVRSAMLP
jgi:hypothetical protein